jgi:hypothetical protein
LSYFVRGDKMQRAIENINSILTIFILVSFNAKNPAEFLISKKNSEILGIFTLYTNLAGPPIDLQRENLEVLMHRLLEFMKTQKTQNDWKEFFKTFWADEIFIRFQEKYAERLIIARAPTKDGNFLSIEDNLELFQKLCKFANELRPSPTQSQLVSQIYQSAGLSTEQKGELLKSSKELDDWKTKYHQLAKKNEKLLAETHASREIIRTLKNLLDRSNEEKSVVCAPSCAPVCAPVPISEPVSEEESELIVCQRELEKLKAAPPKCCICLCTFPKLDQTYLTKCCLNPMHLNCLENCKKLGMNCPQCRKSPHEFKPIGPLSANHPTIPQSIEKIHIGTQCKSEEFSHVDFPVRSAKEIEIPERQIMLLQRILAAGGGGSAASK